MPFTSGHQLSIGNSGNPVAGGNRKRLASNLIIGELQAAVKGDKSKRKIELIVQRMIDYCCDPNTPVPDMLPVAKELFDRAEGKVRQTVSMVDEEGSSVRFTLKIGGINADGSKFAAEANVGADEE